MDESKKLNVIAITDFTDFGDAAVLCTLDDEHIRVLQGVIHAEEGPVQSDGDRLVPIYVHT